MSNLTAIHQRTPIGRLSAYCGAVNAGAAAGAGIAYLSGGDYEAVIHTGDNRTGEGAGDDEQILLEFAKMPVDVDKMAVTVTIQ